jgi:clan AA aspartic protease (TIGR02281 family)
LSAKFFWSFLLLALCRPINEPSANEFFRWFDEKGAIHFTDELYSVPEPYRNTSREGRATPVRERAIAISKGDFPKGADPQRYILPLTWEGGRLFVDAKINDRIPLRYIVDTGANMTVIPASFASRLGFDKRNSLSIDIRGVGGVVEGRLIEVDSLKVGEAEARNFDMIVIEDSLGGTALLGADFLSRFRMEINYIRGQMVLHSGEGPYDGYPTAWWQEKFRLYERLKRVYERRISQNQHHMQAFGASAESRNPEVRYGRGISPLQPVADEIKEFENYLGILANKIGALQIRANRVALPQTFRQ